MSEHSQRQRRQTKIRRKDDRGNAIALIMANQRSCVGRQRNEEQMDKVQRQSPFVTQDRRLENPVVIDPEPGDQKKPDNVGDKVGNLVDQIRRQFGIGDPGNIRNFEVQDEQREGDRVYTI